MPINKYWYYQTLIMNRSVRLGKLRIIKNEFEHF